MPLKSIERLIFFLLLALHLAPLWSVRYFLTIDGPCHLYNAKVLADFSASADLRDFYESWVYLNLRFEPNWFSHFFMKLGFAAGIPAFLNEKLLQTFYVLSFALGLRFAIKKLAPKGVFLSSLGLLFAYHHVFQMGFYNYSLSLAGMFWPLAIGCGAGMPGRRGGKSDSLRFFWLCSFATRSACSFPFY
jgi:hypothetical protein